LAHVELALALQSGGKGDQALYVLEKAAGRFPASVELRCFYAEMVGAGGDLIEAMAQFREVVAMVRFSTDFRDLPLALGRILR